MNDPGSGLWALDTLTYTATSNANAGKALSIVFDDNGTASGSGQVNIDDVTLTIRPPLRRTSTPSLNLFGSDADGGCDTDVDSFFNITNTKLCGDVFGVMGKSNGALSVNGSLGNYEFHVEDSNSGGNHSQQSGNLAETLTIGGITADAQHSLHGHFGIELTTLLDRCISSTNVMRLAARRYTVITDATGPIGRFRSQPRRRLGVRPKSGRLRYGHGHHVYRHSRLTFNPVSSPTMSRAVAFAIRSMLPSRRRWRCSAWRWLPSPVSGW